MIPTFNSYAEAITYATTNELKSFHVWESINGFEVAIGVEIGGAIFYK